MRSGVINYWLRVCRMIVLSEYSALAFYTAGPSAFPFNLLAAAEQTNIATGIASPNIPRTLSYGKQVAAS